jgi:hypothetical protein
MIAPASFTRRVVSEAVHVRAADHERPCAGGGERPKPPFTIRIGDRLLSTTRAGDLRTTISGRGLLSVDLAVTPATYERCGWFTHWQEALQLDGKPEPTLNLKLRWAD